MAVLLRDGGPIRAEPDALMLVVFTKPVICHLVGTVRLKNPEQTIEFGFALCLQLKLIDLLLQAIYDVLEEQLVVALAEGALLFLVELVGLEAEGEMLIDEPTLEDLPAGFVVLSDALLHILEELLQLQLQERAVALDLPHCPKHPEVQEVYPRHKLEHTGSVLQILQHFCQRHLQRLDCVLLMREGPAFGADGSAGLALLLSAEEGDAFVGMERAGSRAVVNHGYK